MLSLALAGKPNAGKSTFFAAATMAEVETADYPFTTIDPNRGVSAVRTRCPCLDLEERCGNERCHDGKRYVPIELVDVAGLVPGAHEGRGLGNQFLDALTDADAIVNVVDASGGTDEEGEPVEVGTHDPRRDVDFVEEEMDQWLAGIVERNWETVERRSRSPGFDIDEALADMLTGLGASEADVAVTFRTLEYPDAPDAWTAEQRATLARRIRERTKPFVIAANKADVAPEELLERLLAVDRPVITTTAEGELALRQGVAAGVLAYDPGDDDFEVVGELSASQRAGLETIRSVMAAWGGTGVQRTLDVAVFDTLDHVTAFPVQNENRWTDGQGNVLPDAVLLPRGSTPRDLAGAIHTDIAEGYLHAVDARSGRRIADDYELEEGDVIKVVSTAS